MLPSLLGLALVTAASAASLPVLTTEKNETEVSVDRLRRNSECYQYQNGSWCNMCYPCVPCNTDYQCYQYNCYYPCWGWSTPPPVDPTYPVWPTEPPVWPTAPPVWPTAPPVWPTEPPVPPIWPTAPTLWPTVPTIWPTYYPPIDPTPPPWQTRPPIDPTPPPWYTRPPIDPTPPPWQTRPPIDPTPPPWYTRPPIDPTPPPWQTRPPIDPTPPPWQTRPPIDPTPPPWYTRPPIDPTPPPWQTRPPIDPTPPPWNTRPPIDPTPPPWPTYTPLWPTKTPRPTRPPYTPLWPTKTPRPTRPPYTPLWPTKTPRPTRPPYTPLWPTKTPRPTRPDYTPLWPTKTPRPTRPDYTPLWPTKTPRPTRPDYTPLWPTKTPRPTRPAYTPHWPTKTPISTLPSPTSSFVKRGCRTFCARAEGNVCCEDREGECPATEECSNSVDYHGEPKVSCKLDIDCGDGHGCCYDECGQEYVCKELVKHLVQRDVNSTKVTLTALLPEGSSDTTVLLKGEIQPLKYVIGKDLNLHLHVTPENEETSVLSKIVACAETHLKEPDLLPSFALCLWEANFTQANNPSIARRCSESHRLDWTQLSTCVVSEEGRHLLTGARERDRHLLQEVEGGKNEPIAFVNGIQVPEEATPGWLKRHLCSQPDIGNTLQKLCSAA